jgi:hypothetical protein
MVGAQAQVGPFCGQTWLLRKSLREEMRDGTLVGCFWHRSAIPIKRPEIYLHRRAVLGEGCPGVS